MLDCVIIHTEEDSAYLEMETTPNHCLVEENMSHLHVLCDSEENIINSIVGPFFVYVSFTKHLIG